MDLLQSPEVLQGLAHKVILLHFLLDYKLEMAMHKYDLWNGMALVGGLFSHFQILQKHEYYTVLEVMKKTIDNCNIIYLKQSLPSDSRLMGERVVERILSVGLAMINLQIDPNISIPIQLNALAVTPQPLEQSLWDSINVANSNLDWLVHSSAS